MKPILLLFTAAALGLAQPCRRPPVCGAGVHAGLSARVRFIPVAAGSASPRPVPSPEQAIRDAMSRQQDAWNRGDIPAFMQSYENSPQTTFVGAAVTRGYQPVLEGYRKRYPTPDAMGRLTFSDLEVHMLGPGHAWVLGRFHLARSAAGGGDKSGIFTLVWKKTKAGWKIILDHTS